MVIVELCAYIYKNSFFSPQDCLRFQKLSTNSLYQYYSNYFSVKYLSINWIVLSLVNICLKTIYILICYNITF